MNDYESALEVIRDATRVYQERALAYRAGVISDDEYLAARAEMELAEAVFDVAFAAAAELSSVQS